LLDEHRDAAVRLLRAEAFHRLGMLADSQQKPDEALDWYGQSLRLREGLAAENPDDRACQRDLARSHGFLGDVWLIKGDYDRARDAYDEAERIRQRLVETPAADPEQALIDRHQYARSLFNTGNHLLWKGEPDKALAAFRREKGYLEGVGG